MKTRKDVIGDLAFNPNRIAYTPYYPNVIKSSNQSNSPMNANERSGNAHVSSTSLDSIFDSSCYESILVKLFRDILRVDLEDCQVLITEDITYPETLRERIVEILLSRLSVHSCFVANPLTLTSYAFSQSPVVHSSSFNAVCVLDCGCYHTRAQVIYEGYSMPKTLITSRVAGKALDEYLSRRHALAIHTSKQSEKGSHFFAISEASTLNFYSQIKESICEIVNDYEDLQSTLRPGNNYSMIVEETQGNNETNDDGESDKPIVRRLGRQYSNQSLFVFPDGSTVDIGCEKYDCGEGLFQPSKIDMPQELSVVDCIWSSIKLAVMAMEDNHDLHRHLLQNILVTGGTSMMKGFITRLENELNRKVKEWKLLSNTDDDAPVVVKVHVLDEDRRLCAWKGAAKFASDPNNIQWITKTDFADYGNDIIHQRCIL